jgi:lipoyl(octanoyl) transferase
MIEIQDWGLIDYREAWDKQKDIAAGIHSTGKAGVLAICQHPSVITIGRGGSAANILSEPAFLKSLGIDVVETDRGGDVTIHNPSQLVGYPIFDLAHFRKDLHWFLREIEACIIELLEKYNIKGGRVEGLTGVWVQGQRKICAIGLHCSRWITSHGFALNVSNNLNEFSLIVPCGISDKSVTSIEKETAARADYDLVKADCIRIFIEHFGKKN